MPLSLVCDTGLGGVPKALSIIEGRQELLSLRMVEMPAPSEALPGRPTPLPTAQAHFVNGNPLLRYDAFAARASGIRAMLPHVDEFRTVHNLESLRTLVDLLSRPAPALIVSALVGFVTPGQRTSSGDRTDSSKIHRLSNHPWSPRKKPWSDV